MTVLAGGCTFSPVKVKQASLAGKSGSPHHAALVISQELRFRPVSQTDSYPIGPALADNARNVTGKCFQQVDAVASEQGAASLAADDLILIPRVVKSNSSRGHGKFNLTLVVEWTAKDRATQKTVWLKTFTADGTEPMGSTFTGFKHRR